MWPVFVALRKILRAHESSLVVTHDESGNYELTTKTKGANGKPLNGTRMSNVVDRGGMGCDSCDFLDDTWDEDTRGSACST